MVKGKITNLLLACVMGVSIVAAVDSSTYAKVGDNPIKYQNMYTYKDVSYGSYADIFCNPGYTQVTANTQGYYGALKYARYHTSEKLIDGYIRIDNQEKSTKSQPCYTTFVSVSDRVSRRYHRGYIRQGTSNKSPIMREYKRTVYKTT